jgi:hypothetical protein
VGDFQRDQPHGLGIFYDAQGKVRDSGRWDQNRIAERVELDRSSYPFES